MESQDPGGLADDGDVALQPCHDSDYLLVDSSPLLCNSCDETLTLSRNGKIMALRAVGDTVKLAPTCLVHAVQLEDVEGDKM